MLSVSLKRVEFGFIVNALLATTLGSENEINDYKLTG